jgi:hypothetical protein
MTTTPARTRADIEAEIASKRRERELYVSAQGVGKIHGEIDALLEEWEDARDVAGEADMSKLSSGDRIGESMRIVQES